MRIGKSPGITRTHRFLRAALIPIRALFTIRALYLTLYVLCRRPFPTCSSLCLFVWLYASLSQAGRYALRQRGGSLVFRDRQDCLAGFGLRHLSGWKPIPGVDGPEGRAEFLVRRGQLSEGAPRRDRSHPIEQYHRGSHLLGRRAQWGATAPS